jgi:toxin ParE1/3/4
MRLELSSFVEGDLDTIADYIAQDNPTPAVSFLREIGEGARMAIVGPYVILFRTMGEIVRIERVVYGGRDLLALFARRKKLEPASAGFDFFLHVCDGRHRHLSRPAR